MSLATISSYTPLYAISLPVPRCTTEYVDHRRNFYRRSALRYPFNIHRIADAFGLLSGRGDTTTHRRPLKFLADSHAQRAILSPFTTLSASLRRELPRGTTSRAPFPSTFLLRLHPDEARPDSFLAVFTRDKRIGGVSGEIAGNQGLGVADEGYSGEILLEEKPSLPFLCSSYKHGAACSLKTPCRRLRFLGILPSTMDILLHSPRSRTSSHSRSLSHSLSLLSRGHSVSTRATPLRAREWRLSRLARPYQRASALPSSLPACFHACPPTCLFACSPAFLLARPLVFLFIFAPD